MWLNRKFKSLTRSKSLYFSSIFSENKEAVDISISWDNSQLDKSIYQINDSALIIFKKNNKFRKLMLIITKSRIFEGFILFLILTSSIILAI